MNENVMLTTYDNPFNPFTQFDAWWKEDLRLGHDCCGTLAKESLTNDVDSDSLNERVILETIDRLVAEEPLIFRKVSPSSFEKGA